MTVKKISIAAVTALLFVACNNSSEGTAAGSSSDTATNSTAAQPTDATTNANNSQPSSADLMKPMNDMMGRMQSMQMTGDFDVDFASMMIEHHQGGIDMAQIEVANGKNDQLKAKAQEILNKQKKEQQELRDFVSSYKPSGMKHGEGELQKSMTEMKNKMASMTMSNDVDKDFAMMMISHHQDGISMGKMELKNGMSDKLKQMTQKSSNDQQKDISELKALATQ